MKYILFVTLFFSLSAFAKCKVYGISDSPQKLNCNLQNFEVNVSCHKKNYYLNNEKVEIAFHMEVEEGATPLVFKTNSGKTLIVLPEDEILAEYDDGSFYLQGVCTK